MSVVRILTPNACCLFCRAIARSHVSKQARNPTFSPLLWIHSSTRSRTISSVSSPRPDDNIEIIKNPKAADLEQELEPSQGSPDTVSSATPTPYDSTVNPQESLNPSEDASLPWYLRNRPPPTPQQAAIIPELPHNSPPLLKPILTYIADTAGLDNLHLLDLRHLDPPPALGPKLIMLICTARSEKHLHVSADRFCRHLRREYGLRADAAGLLGRNELKIKLRRKMKRMKLLANIGSSEEAQGNVDDGIRTGWICCTIGKIEPHPEDREMPGTDVEEFVGFRDVKPGVNVVVQMFTEEKREEVDLETLWGGVLRTQERRNDVVEEFVEGEVEAEEEQNSGDPFPGGGGYQRPKAEFAPRVSSLPTHQYNRPRQTVGDVFPSGSDARPLEQLRRNHSLHL